MLKDDKMRKYSEMGCEAKAQGRGHISWIKQEVNRKQLIYYHPFITEKN